MATRIPMLAFAMFRHHELLSLWVFGVDVVLKTKHTFLQRGSKLLCISTSVKF